MTSSINNKKGTDEYLAPEIHNAKEVKAEITKQDVWAIGVITYELCTDCLPFKGESASAMINSIINDPHTPITSKEYSEELKELISYMLIKDPNERPSIKQLIQVQIIWNAIISFDKGFEGKLFFQPRGSLVKKDSSFKEDSLNPH